MFIKPNALQKSVVYHHGTRYLSTQSVVRIDQLRSHPWQGRDKCQDRRATQKSSLAVNCRPLFTSQRLGARARTAKPKPASSNENHHFYPQTQEKRDVAVQETFEERLNRSQLQTLEDKGTQKHVAKVFATTASTVGASAAACAGTVALGAAVPLWFGGLGIIPLFGFYMTDTTTSPAVRGGLLAAFTVTAGVGLSPLIGLALAVDPLAVPIALGGTTALMAGTSAAALLAPRASMLKFAPVLGGGAAVLFGLGLIGMGQAYFTGSVSPILFNLSLYGGFALAIGFTAYDMQNMIEDYRAGNADYLRHSVDMFVNFLMMFRRLLFLLLNRD